MRIASSAFSEEGRSAKPWNDVDGAASRCSGDSWGFEANGVDAGAFLKKRLTWSGSALLRKLLPTIKRRS
jgi:hypothetical protein